jgi:hypothetical protein
VGDNLTDSTQLKFTQNSQSCYAPNIEVKSKNSIAGRIPYAIGDCDFLSIGDSKVTAYDPSTGESNEITYTFVKPFRVTSVSPSEVFADPDHAKQITITGEDFDTQFSTDLIIYRAEDSNISVSPSQITADVTFQDVNDAVQTEFSKIVLHQLALILLYI